MSDYAGFDDPEGDPEYEENLRLGLAIPEKSVPPNRVDASARAWLTHESIKERRAARPTRT